MVFELPEVTAGRLLSAAGKSLGIAESCTGGLLCSRLTDVSGSSAYLQGGVVVYSYEAKEHLLGVSHETLMTYGAVSREVALEMARGARQVFSADLGIGITGIAGPGGGMPGKPVGLVFIALSSPELELCERYVWSGDRRANKQQSVDAALRMVVRHLTKERS